MTHPDPVPHTTNGAMLNRLDELAVDIGRLRRRAEPGSSLEHLADRLACHIEALHLILTPSAGALALWHAPGDPVAVDEAIAIVDARWTRLQTQLRKTAA